MITHLIVLGTLVQILRKVLSPSCCSAAPCWPGTDSPCTDNPTEPSHACKAGCIYISQIQREAQRLLHPPKAPDNVGQEPKSSSCSRAQHILPNCLTPRTRAWRKVLYRWLPWSHMSIPSPGTLHWQNHPASIRILKPSLSTWHVYYLSLSDKEDQEH